MDAVARVHICMPLIFGLRDTSGSHSHAGSSLCGGRCGPRTGVGGGGLRLCGRERKSAAACVHVCFILILMHVNFPIKEQYNRPYNL